MFENHLKIAWRNLIKDRLFTFLNLLVSVGLACTLMIYLWVHDEMSVAATANPVKSLRTE